jgi:hypothetical protein
VVTLQQPQRARKVNAKRRQPTLIQDRTYVGTICTKNIHYFNRYVRVRAYAKKGKSLGATATTAALCTVMFHFFIVTRL